jgi:hypothetical protein
VAFLNSIEQVRAIDWGARYLWDLRFPSVQGVVGAPAPFDSWFPAVDVTVDAAVLESHTFEIGDTKMAIPLATSNRTIQLSFHDSDTGVLFQWLEAWMNDTVRRVNRTVATVKEAARMVQLIKMDRQHRQLSTHSYWVVPDGKLAYNGSSEGAAHLYTVTFHIVG